MCHDIVYWSLCGGAFGSDFNHSCSYSRSRYGFLLDPLFTVFSLGIIASGFVYLPVEEKSYKIKHLQIVSGLSKMTYWLFTYVWDLIWFLAVTVLTLIPFLVFKDPFYYEEMPILVMLLLSYGLAIIPWLYVWSFLFNSPTTAYVWVFCLNFSSGSVFIIYDIIERLIRKGVFNHGD